MTTPARARYAGHRFPAEIIGHAVWLYFRFPLGLRMVEELLAARRIIVSHETVRQWARKFGQQFANQIRRRLPRVGDKWQLNGRKATPLFDGHTPPAMGAFQSERRASVGFLFKLGAAGRIDNRPDAFE